MNKPFERTYFELSDSLHTPSNNGLSGMYIHVIDTLIVGVQNDTVLRHEIAHRALCNTGMGFSSFAIVRQITQYIHAFLFTILHLVDERKIELKGNSLSNLKVKATKPNPDLENQVNDLLFRVRKLEELNDIIWRGLEPISEIMAIDFMDGIQVSPPTELYYGNWTPREIPRNSILLDIIAGKIYPEEKNELFEAVISRYPASFGGYHVSKYGSFQNIARTAWDTYNSIGFDLTRKNLLRSLLNIIYFDEKGDWEIIDPFNALINIAPLIKDQEIIVPINFIEGFINQKNFEVFIDKVVYGIPKDTLRFSSTSIINRLVEEQMSPSGLVKSVPSIPRRYVCSTSDSFLKFFTKDEKQYVTVNPAFILEAENMKLPNAWWKIISIVEAFRQSIKRGKPLFCPFQDWEFEDLSHISKKMESTKCNEKCVIRNLMSVLSEQSSIVETNGICS